MGLVLHMSEYRKRYIDLDTPGWMLTWYIQGHRDGQQICFDPYTRSRMNSINDITMWMNMETGWCFI